MIKGVIHKDATAAPLNQRSRTSTATASATLEMDASLGQDLFDGIHDRSGSEL
jgi:hypothetical protein